LLVVDDDVGNWNYDDRRRKGLRRKLLLLLLLLRLVVVVVLGSILLLLSSSNDISTNELTEMLSATIGLAFFRGQLVNNLVILVVEAVVGHRSGRRRDGVGEGDGVDKAATGTAVADAVEVVVSAVADDTLAVVIVVVAVEGFGLENEVTWDVLEENNFVGRSDGEEATCGEALVLDVTWVFPEVVDVDVVNNSVVQTRVDVFARAAFTLSKRTRSFTFLGVVVRAEVEFLGGLVDLDTSGNVVNVAHGDCVERVTRSVVDFHLVFEIDGNASGTLGRKELGLLLLMAIASRSWEESVLLVSRMTSRGIRCSSSSSSLGLLVVVAVHFVFFSS
jgi:hypothetical protein